MLWLIPENVEKPADGRRKGNTDKSLPKNAMTVNQLARYLSISEDTAKIWLRLGKINYDLQNQYFSKSYAKKVAASLKSSSSSQLKSRRNKVA